MLMIFFWSWSVNNIFLVNNIFSENFVQNVDIGVRVFNWT